MAPLRFKAAAVLMLSALLAGCGWTASGNGSGRPAPEAVSRHAGRAFAGTAAKKLIVAGFWTHHKSATLAALSSHGRAISVLMPFWYSVTASGALHSKVNVPLLTEARKLKIPIEPLVNDATGTQAFLTSKATRKVAVQSIDHMVASMHFQGVNIDFEPPHTHLKSELSAFMVQLRDSLPKTDTITMDVVPHSGGAYNYSKLAPEVSQFILMSYDEHSDGTPAGPVAAYTWVKSITARLLKVVPASKIDLGVALYGYSWAAGSTHAVTIPYDTITPAMKAHGTWNTRYQEMTTTIGHTVYWWENRKGISEKIALAKKDHLAGLAFWQVGYANNAIYSLLLKQVGRQP